MMRMLRQWLQSYLGVSDVTKMVNIVEARAKTRHRELLDHLEHNEKVLIARLNTIEGLAVSYLDRIEKMMIAGHIQEPRQFTPPVLDWDTVQANALAQLEKEQ